jgi:hypothetical protein
MDNDVYYRLFKCKDGYIRAVTMQWFDEYDYDQDRFIDDRHYSSEEEALGSLVKRFFDGKVKVSLELQ